MSTVESVLLAGSWSPAHTVAGEAGRFHAFDPSTGARLSPAYPVSTWEDLDRALDAGVEAAVALAEVEPERIARFLEALAAGIEARAEALSAQAALETGLPVRPRLLEGELPRTTDQLRQAARAARERTWTEPIIDHGSNIRSMRVSLGGPVAVFGPNNFPLAFNSLGGGDFAAAIAAGNPVIAKAHPLHPGTCRILAECTVEALEETGMPRATVQMLYHFSTEDGLRLAADRRLAALAFTGSRAAGLALSRAATRAGVPAYVELGGINPVVLLPGALREDLEGVVAALVGSALLGVGQFCTNPGVVLFLDGPEAGALVERTAASFAEAPVGALLSEQVREGLHATVSEWIEAGARRLTGGERLTDQGGFRHQNTLLWVSARQFIEEPALFQREAFGNALLLVQADAVDELLGCVEALDGCLAGSVYASDSAEDAALAARVLPALSRKVGRILDNKMPTGVAVVPSMVHGGPFPSTGHAGFTSVGIPASMRRFSRPFCFDGVRAERLPPELQEPCALPGLWRMVDGRWEQAGR